jgi:hypothetical protein
MAKGWVAAQIAAGAPPLSSAATACAHVTAAAAIGSAGL